MTHALTRRSRTIDSMLAAREAMGPDGNLISDCVTRTGTVEWAVAFAGRLPPARLNFMSCSRRCRRRPRTASPWRRTPPRFVTRLTEAMVLDHRLKK